MMALAALAGMPCVRVCVCVTQHLGRDVCHDDSKCVLLHAHVIASTHTHTHSQLINILPRCAFALRSPGFDEQ